MDYIYLISVAIALLGVCALVVLIYRRGEKYAVEKIKVQEAIHTEKAIKEIAGRQINVEAHYDKLDVPNAWPESGIVKLRDRNQDAAGEAPKTRMSPKRFNRPKNAKK